MGASDLLADSEPVLKDWTMKRNCSISPRQFVCLYVSLALFSLAIAFMLVLVGAWLVLPFIGIELLAVGIAFAIYARHAVDYERIRLFPNRLVIERVSAEQLTQFEFNPRWVRVEPGATPRDQLAPVVQLALAPPPTQRSAASMTRDSSNSIPYARSHACFRTWRRRRAACDSNSTPTPSE